MVSAMALFLYAGKGERARGTYINLETAMQG